MHDWFDSWFAWPDGGVWSNVVASVIWTVPALAWHHRKMKQHITDTLGQGAECENRERVGS